MSRLGACAAMPRPSRGALPGNPCPRGPSDRTLGIRPLASLGRWTTLLLLGGCLIGCGGSDDEKSPLPTSRPRPNAAPSPTPSTPPAPLAGLAAPAAAPETESASANADRGRTQYQMFCASCHGATGAGDGPLAETLNPKPARHNDGNYMNALSDEHLFKVIKLGGASVGKSPMMAPWGGALTDLQIRDVIAFIRTLAK